MRKLSEILEEINFNKLMQVFSHKTKVHPVRIFAVILYAYSKDIYSTRDIEIACHENIKFRFLLQNSKIPDHSTISRFLTKIENLLPELFEQFFKIIFKLENISTDTIYIDETKIEAYANKYTFVWRDSVEKYSLKLDEKIENISSNYGKQLRLNRSIQVEGAFAVLKEDMKLRKLKVCGKTSILREIGLFCMGYNFNRYISRSLRNCKGTTLHPLQVA